MELLTIKEVCELLKISRWTLTKLIDKGALKAFKVSDSYRFRRDDVDQMVNDSAVKK